MKVVRLSWMGTKTLECPLTAARGALSDGVPKNLINAALAAKSLDGDRQIAFDFGQAIARHSADASSLGDAIQAKYGRTIRLELVMTAATVRAYPGMKRGLGLSPNVHRDRGGRK
jgi:hypothetical protein